MRKLTRRQQIGAVVLTVIALMFITLDFAGGSMRSPRTRTTGALGSLYRGTDSVIGPLRRFIQGIPDVGDNRRQIATLKQDNLNLRRQVADATADNQTAKRLGALQLQADSAGWRMLAARVIATGPGSGFQWTVTVDVGSREHVVAGQTVTDGFGLVGRVVSVYPSTSVVLLAADPKAGVGVRDSRSGELLLATGNASHAITASPLDDNFDVKVGDHLLSGPVGQTTFVSGIEVGLVSKVSRAADGTVTVAIAPTAPQTGLDLLGIVLQQPRDTARAPIGAGTGQ